MLELLGAGAGEGLLRRSRGDDVGQDGRQVRARLLGPDHEEKEVRKTVPPGFNLKAGQCFFRGPAHGRPGITQGDGLDLGIVWAETVPPLVRELALGEDEGDCTKRMRAGEGNMFASRTKTRVGRASIETVSSLDRMAPYWHWPFLPPFRFFDGLLDYPRRFLPADSPRGVRASIFSTISEIYAVSSASVPLFFWK